MCVDPGEDWGLSSPTVRDSFDGTKTLLASLCGEKLLGTESS